MKKNILLLICAVMLNLSAVFATNINVQDAQTVALNFFKITMGNNHIGNLAATLQYTRTEADNTVDFYAFNISPVKGFVIVSATDNDEPIIGYSTESAFPTDFSKIGMNDMLNRWGQELHYVILNNRIATATAAAHWVAYRQGVAPVSMKATSVTPFCQTTWSQENDSLWVPALYNNFCPGKGTGQAVTGCVATAMAQIMKYWAYPQKGIGSNSYDDEQTYGYTANYGTISANFADSTFNWAAMPLTLTNQSSTAQINAVGRIMSCAGISVDMDYDSTGSGAEVFGANPSAQYSYVHYFGYQNVINAIGLNGTDAPQNSEINVPSAAFIDSIEEELNAGRLVEMQGTDHTYGGHTWVIDGYNSNNQFHMNWGWGGYADAYFATTNLDPNDGDALDFTEDIGVLTHILPPNTGSITETASAVSNAVCAGTATQLNATTHTGATYSWTPTTALSSSTIANPVATPTATTTYTVTADSAGITATSSITITVNPVPAATISAPTDPTCYNLSNGSVTVTASGGTAGYSYHWSNGQTTATASNLAQGVYTVTLTDAKTCTATATETLTQPANLTVSTVPSNATCGQANGTIEAVVNGGTSAYTYHWSNSETTATATSLGAGTYDVTITDAHSCSLTVSASITASGTLSLTTSATEPGCFGSSTGSVSATVTGNTGSVTYHWSTGATTSSVQNLSAATYDVTITDGSGCSASAAKSVSQPAALNIAVSVVNSGCGSSATGSATASVTGGTGSYTYHWSTGATGSSITNIPAGTYYVSVTDANSCSTDNSAVVTAGSNSLTSSAVSNNATCYGDNNGTGQITVNNGTAPYSYNWSNGATTQSVNNLAPGSYSVTVTDAHECTTHGNISVTQPAQMEVATSSVAATGTQDNGSAAVANITNATAPYLYDWSNGSTTGAITNIAAGTYTVTITDANGCSQTATDIVPDNSAAGINTVNNEIVFSVYPNPARTQVLVTMDQVNGSTILYLRNILGQTIISQALSATQTQIDLTSLADGVYIVELRQGERSAVKQLVVTK